MASNLNWIAITCNKCSDAIDNEVFKTSCNHYWCRDCKDEYEDDEDEVRCCNRCDYILFVGDMSKIRNTISTKDNEIGRLKKFENEAKRLKTVDDENKQLKEGLASLNDTVAELKAQLKKPDDPLDCSDCKECYTEKKMYICNTCTGSSPNSSKKKNKKHDLKSIGLCSNCVVMDHIVQKHEVVPLFPVLAEAQHKHYSINIGQKKKAYDEKFTEAAELWKGLEGLSDILKKYVDTTTDMIKTSKSSTFQSEFNQFITHHIDEFKEAISKVGEHIASDNGKLNEMLTNFNSQVSEMCNDKCTNVDDILNTLKQLMEQQQSVGNKRQADSTDA